MADGDLLVTISGAALSLLFYENVRSIGEQMGFLLGEALEFIVKTYTDSDNQVETVKIHIIFRLDVTRIDGLDSAMIIQKAAEQHLTSLIPKICESDMEVAELERQVRELRDKIAAQRLTRKMRVNGEIYERASKAYRENCLLEKINFLTKDEMKISDDMCPQREYIPSCAQPIISSNRTLCRNTAACIAKSVNQEKFRRLGRGIPQEENNQQQDTQVFSFSDNERPIPEIVTESICQENSETGVGRGRGSGRGNPEFVPGMKKVRRSPGTSQMHSFRERSITPEQDFSNAEYCAAVSLNSPILRSYSQVTKKTNLDKSNTIASLDI
ncbi:BRISC complex subunit FAM175B-like [Pogonomyrmex barbatus]|uniref:BRISC complex subunit FAM175B-like n=1 Tax=Pogonomyrmex barbatus TaxID=144034 RepID=A0A6I9WB30_9HYME|nr:BRISC complex subunit FAM175B-like [Pogonomyrmex barbatus]